PSGRGRVPRPAEPLHRDPLPLAARRAREPAGRARDHRGDGGGRDHGTAPPRARRGGRAVPARVVPDRARPRPALQLPRPALERGEARRVTLADAIASVVRGEALPGARMEAAMEAILRGDATPAQIAALAVALRMRGETAEELAAAARVMRRHAAPLALSADRLLDTCGTGGDGAGTFNISTVSAIVVAACGVPVAKHGNRAVSSRSGSADVLEALGVRLEAEPAEVARTLDALGITFLFAPAFHGALKHAAPVRRELGLRTFFNLLGPLANPASATHQLLGVYDPARVRQIAEVLGALGVRGAWVVHGHGG